MEGVKVERGHVTGIQTDQGEIDCEIFVNCGGQVKNYLHVHVNHFFPTIDFCCSGQETSERLVFANWH